MNREHFLKLLTRKLLNKLSTEDEQAFAAARSASVEYKQLANELLDRHIVTTPLSDTALEDIWQRIAGHKQVAQHHTAHLLFPRWLKLAAVILLFIGAGLITFRWLTARPATAIVTIAADDEQLYQTLADGTTVCLNHHSAIDYNSEFGKTQRMINLRGEAFFDVAKNAAVPLYIHVGQATIQVKGTAFNVSEHHKQIAIALMRGHILVSSTTHKTVPLYPNQQLNINGSNFIVSDLDTTLKAKAINWMHNSLVFKKERFINLATLLERRYQVKIEIRNEQLKNKRFTGIIKKAQLTEVLDVLSLSYPFSYVINNQVVIIK